MSELINTIIEQDLGLNSFLRSYKNGQHKKSSLRENERNVLEDLRSILQPIREITDNLAGDLYVTGSTILPIISSLKSKLLDISERTNELFDDEENNNELIKKMYTIVIEILDQRYKNNKTLMSCTVIDNGFKFNKHFSFI